METTERPALPGAHVADGVRRLHDGIVNWYLIEDGDRLALVDAGFPGHWPLLTATLGTLDRSLEDLDAIVLTHAHVDHLGFAERARRRCGAEIFVHSADERLAADPTAIARSERSPLRYARHSATRRLILRALATGAPLAKGVGELTTFADGDTLEAVPGRPRAVHTPGHTEGHCALHLPDRGVLLSGDALVTRDPYTGATGPRIVAAAATADSRRALASLDRLEDLDADVVLPGHGEPWRGTPAAAVAAARAAGPS